MDQLQDEFSGQGGSYVVKDGKRVRVEETVEHPDGNCARDADGQPVPSGAEGPHGAAPAADTSAPPRSKPRSAKPDTEPTGS
ncbi:MAG: hypothetical protein AB1513_08855 [Pseudomonadota bacterium]